MENRPTVSVLMVAYNHGKFIGRAIQSVLDQKVDFPFEIVIGEDCSTDRTKEVIKRYEQNYPHLFKAKYHEVNLGMMGRLNFLDTYQRCKGKYIAMLEGDDYWVDCTKLQKQIDFLERNSEYSFCYSNSVIVNENDEQAGSFDNFLPGTITISDLLQKGWVAPTASLVFYNSPDNKIPDWLKKSPNGDYIIQLICACKGGKGFGFNEAFVAYRKHSGGLSASSNYHYQSIFLDCNMLKLMDYFDEHTKKRHIKYTNQKRIKHLRSIISKRPLYNISSVKSLIHLMQLMEFSVIGELLKQRLDHKQQRNRG